VLADGAGCRKSSRTKLDRTNVVGKLELEIKSHQYEREYAWG